MFLILTEIWQSFWFFLVPVCQNIWPATNRLLVSLKPMTNGCRFFSFFSDKWLFFWAVSGIAATNCLLVFLKPANNFCQNPWHQRPNLQYKKHRWTAWQRHSWSAVKSSTAGLSFKFNSIKHLALPQSAQLWQERIIQVNRFDFCSSCHWHMWQNGENKIISGRGQTVHEKHEPVAPFPYSIYTVRNIVMARFYLCRNLWADMNKIKEVVLHLKGLSHEIDFTMGRGWFLNYLWASMILKYKKYIYCG